VVSCKRIEEKLKAILLPDEDGKRMVTPSWPVIPDDAGFDYG
jgi:hypothetical protein